MPSFISWIPTPHEHIEGFFEMAPVSSSDVVYDLGAGDGRLLFAALDRGAGRAVGVELDPERVRTAREEAKKKALEDKITFLESDVMEANLSNASVIFCYLCTAASTALKPKFESELKPGCRVVMETFPVPGWKPVRTSKKEYKEFYLYVMPPEKTDEYPGSDAGPEYFYEQL
ncbi:MAG: class I SAM-dependent methyltransferase [Chloroflexota bacterium]